MRQIARQRFEQHHAQRVPIRRLADPSLAKELGRHVGRRSGDLRVRVARGRSIELANQSEIQHAGERITTIMPMPEDEASWDRLDVMFATSRGTVRRNKLSDFIQVNRGGKIAMKLDEGEAIVDVEICTERDDVLLTTANGQCIRFAVPEVRASRAAIPWACAASRSAGATPSSRWRFCAMSRRARRNAQADLKMRRAVTGEGAGPDVETVDDDLDDDIVEAETPAPEREADLAIGRYAEMSAGEQFILTISERGFGKRTSSYEYRITGRGGKGITAMAVNNRNGKLVASFPVQDGDQIMLVTNDGQLIRVPVDGIRIVSRGMQGVTVLPTRDGSRVVSVEHIEGEDPEESGEAEAE